jgi:hypothetical protein
MIKARNDERDMDGKRKSVGDTCGRRDGLFD